MGLVEWEHDGLVASIHATMLHGLIYALFHQYCNESIRIAMLAGA